MDDLKEVQCRRPCSAFFHKVCAETWLKGVSSCPACKINPMLEGGSKEAPEAAAFRNATNQIWEGDDVDVSDAYDEDDDVDVSDAYGEGGAASYPDFHSFDEESLEYWSELGYHWDRFVLAWVNDEGRTPAQEDPREYYTEPPDRSMHISQYDGAEFTDNHTYWRENGFEYDESRGAWVFSHGELQGLLPSEVSSFWAFLYIQGEHSDSSDDNTITVQCSNCGDEIEVEELGLLSNWECADCIEERERSEEKEGEEETSTGEEMAEIMAIYLRNPNMDLDIQTQTNVRAFVKALKIYKTSREPIIVVTNEFGTYNFPQELLQSIIENDETNTVKRWFDSL